MTPRIPVSILVASAATCLLASPAARADQACSGAYVAAQKQRKKGALIEARRQLRACLNASCADFMRTDCATWLEQVESDIPSVVLRAEDSNGGDLVDVSVRIDGAAEARRPDGKALELDPGRHEFEFRWRDRTETVSVVLAEGRQNREVRAVFRVPNPERAVAEPARPGDAGPPPKQRSTIESVGPWVLFGVSAVGFGSFAYFGLDKEQRESDCAGRACDASDEDAARRSALWADVSLGVGLSAAAGAIYLLATRPGIEVAPGTRASAAITPGGGWLSLRGAF